MRYKNRICSIVLIILVSICLRTQAAHGQITNWHLVDTQFFPLHVGLLYQINASGDYIFNYDDYSMLVNVRDLSVDLVSETRTDASRWLNNTILYRELSWQGFSPPNCTDSRLLPIVRYVATDKSKQLYCLNSPQVTILSRFPFDDYVLFGDNRYLIGLRTNSVTDLQGQFTSDVLKTDTLSWIAFDQIWWDPHSQIPKGTVTYSSNVVPFETDAQESLQLCPMTQVNCQTILSIQYYIRGNLADFVLSPDGQTLLWGAYQIVSPYPIRTGPPGIGTVEDFVAFATNIQSGNTVEIFRLSQYNTSSARGIAAHWSENGSILAIQMRTYDRSFSASTKDDGIILAKFSSSSDPQH